LSRGYNEVAGQSIHRLEGLSDGVFAVAMTLLVLDLHTPAQAAIHSEGHLWRALVALSPRILVYLMSFLTLGIFWVGQQTQLNHLAGSNRNLTWIHLGFLFSVSLMPFSTSLMAEFMSYRIALLAYWMNILLPGAILFASWRYARKAALLKKEMAVDIACHRTPDHHRARALCPRRSALPRQHLLEPRLHLAGADELRAGATPRLFREVVTALRLMQPSNKSSPRQPPRRRDLPIRVPRRAGWFGYFRCLARNLFISNIVALGWPKTAASFGSAMISRLFSGFCNLCLRM